MSKEAWIITIVSALFALFSSVFLIHYEKFIDSQDAEPASQTLSEPATSSQVSQNQPQVSLWLNQNGKKIFNVNDKAQLFYRIDNLPADTEVYVTLLSRLDKDAWQPLLENQVTNSGHVHTFPTNAEDVLTLQAGKQRFAVFVTSIPFKWKKLNKKEPNTKGLAFWTTQKIVVKVNE